MLDEILEAEGIQREQSNSTLWKVFQKVTQTYKQKPVVIDADDLQRNPGEEVHITPLAGSDVRCYLLLLLGENVFTLSPL